MHHLIAIPETLHNLSYADLEIAAGLCLASLLVLRNTEISIKPSHSNIAKVPDK